MKRNKIFLLIFMLFLCAIIVISGNRKKETIPDEIFLGTFDLTDYQWAIDDFPFNEKVEEISDGAAAAEKAKLMWLQEFGDEDQDGVITDPSLGRPVEVYYTESQDCWLVKGTLPAGWLGAVPCAIIQGDGTFLALWRD